MNEPQLCPSAKHGKVRVLGDDALRDRMHRVDDAGHAARAEVAERVRAQPGLAVTAMVVGVDDVPGRVQARGEPCVPPRVLGESVQHVHGRARCSGR